MTTDLYTLVLGEGDPVIMVHGSMGTGMDTFGKQQPLSDQFKLILVDRRGYGKSPDGRSDFETDAHDIVNLMGGGAHLVGQSYGGVVCLVAAGLRPDLVHSLTVIEPPAWGLVKERDFVQQAIKGVELAYTETDPEEFYFKFIAFPPNEPRPDIGPLTPEDIRQLRTAMNERPPWEADLKLDTLAAAQFPKLVVSGARVHLPEHKRTAPRTLAFKATCDFLIERIGAQHMVFENAAHNPQMETADEFNNCLRSFLNAASL
jgi:pimeloyl-ACP methyl ester carboxylesterase